MLIVVNGFEINQVFLNYVEFVEKVINLEV